MASLDDIDASLPLELWACQHDLDGPATRLVESVAPIILEGADVVLFLQWAKQESWRERFECDLQSIANDEEGRKLLTTWIPLVTFRESFCAGGRQLQDPDTQELMERIRALTLNWRSAQVDTVDINGRAVCIAEKPIDIPIPREIVQAAAKQVLDSARFAAFELLELNKIENGKIVSCCFFIADHQRSHLSKGDGISSFTVGESDIPPHPLIDCAHTEELPAGVFIDVAEALRASSVLAEFARSLG